MEELYVLGHPVGHSKSPAMHNAAYDALGLDWRYGFMDCPNDEGAQAFLDSRSWLACNITMPYKPLAYAVADVRTAESRLARGANVLVNWEGRLFADNTDGKGCRSYLRRCGIDFEGARVAVCGTGPTSLAIMHACAAAGADVGLHGRDLSRTRGVIAEYRKTLAESGASGERSGVDLSESSLPRAFDYGPDGLASIAEADVVVDATPLGMHPQDPAPFDTSVLSAGQAVFDVVYGHGETALVAAARGVGCSVYDGAGMLVAQAVETVRDIALMTGLFSLPENLDLFAVMADAAGFRL